MAVLDKVAGGQITGREAQTAAMIGYLRGIVLAEPASRERFHAIYLDERRTYLGDVQLGEGRSALLSLRMRDLFSKALAVNARGVLIAHNHPSGDCRPSLKDISSTKRLKEIAGALDIELVDHLIITRSALYSMRAGGQL